MPYCPYCSPTVWYGVKEFDAHLQGIHRVPRIPGRSIHPPPEGERNTDFHNLSTWVQPGPDDRAAQLIAQSPWKASAAVKAVTIPKGYPPQGMFRSFYLGGQVFVTDQVACPKIPSAPAGFHPEDGGETTDTDPEVAHQKDPEPPSKEPAPLGSYSGPKVGRGRRARRTLTVRVGELEGRVEELEDFCSVVNGHLNL